MIEPVERTGRQIGNQRANLSRLANGVQQGETRGVRTSPNGGRAILWFGTAAA